MLSDNCGGIFVISGFHSLTVLFEIQRRNHDLATLLEQHSSMNSTLMNQIEDLVRIFTVY